MPKNHDIFSVQRTVYVKERRRTYIQKKKKWFSEAWLEQINFQEVNVVCYQCFNEAIIRISKMYMFNDFHNFCLFLHNYLATASQATNNGADSSQNASSGVLPDLSEHVSME